MVALEMGPGSAAAAAAAPCEKGGAFAGGFSWFKSLPTTFATGVLDFAEKMNKVGKDDPRRIIHSLKVGMALTLVSLFYYFQRTYDSFGVTAMWAIMTVVVVFEFSVGATLSKGINRGLATMLAGALGVGVHHLACLSGHTGEPIILGLVVFLQAAATTFLRFNPEVKARYDYGLLIFILTFSLVSVSGFREDEIWAFANKRFSTVLIGSCACVIVSVVVCPVWAGEDLHKNIASNIEKLSIFLEEFGDEYFKTSPEHREESSRDGDENSSSLEGYKSILNSKASEENLANFARWEPAHGGFMFRHPWHQYLKVGDVTRQCAYHIEALNRRRLTSNIQTPPEIRQEIQETCTEMSSQSGKALKELSLSIKRMSHPTLALPHLSNAKAAAKELRTLLQSSKFCQGRDLLAALSAAAVASLLIDVVLTTEQVMESVRELASQAQFKNVAEEANVSPEKSNRYHNDVASSITKSHSCPHLQVVIVPSNTPAILETGNPRPSVPSARAEV